MRINDGRPTKHVLVTGGAGYIGSHTAKTLAKSGYTPVVLDDLSTGHDDAVRWGPFVQGDISDEALVRNTVRTYGIETVIHFAANAYVGESIVNPRRYFHNNFVKALSLINAVTDCGVRSFVFSSTCATYGMPQSVPIDESHPQAPVNPYGESKLMVERALHWYAKAYDLRSVILRYFNAAGTDPDGELGERHDPETHLIPLAIRAAIFPEEPLYLFGVDYSTPDGTAIRDYIHVADLADAHVRALSYLEAGGASTAINLGTGIGNSVREVIQAVQRVSGRAPAIVEQGRRPGDPAVLVAAAGKAEAVLGWKPRFTRLDEIVETAWRWNEAQRGVLVGV